MFGRFISILILEIFLLNLQLVSKNCFNQNSTKRKISHIVNLLKMGKAKYFIGIFKRQ